MVQNFEIPWAAWYEDKEFNLEFPDSWEIDVYRMKDAPELSQEEIETAINNPIATSQLKELAEGKENVVIVIEDISRPTRMEVILNLVLSQLNDAGIPDNKITILIALGAHRPMNRQDFIKKLGESIVDRINIENHHPYENLVYIRDSEKGTPIYLNKTYNDADLKIAIGTVLPHPLAGYGGGAKIILPGICGMQTLEANHKAGVRGIGGGIGFVTELRKDIEDVCGKVGLDFSINIVSTVKRGIAGIFAGHFIEAHRKAMDLAKEVYSTEIPQDLNLDIAFFNLYPEDTELNQFSKGFNLLLSSKSFLKSKSAIVLLTACSEGRGYHSLLGETGAKLFQNWGDSTLFKGKVGKKNFCIFSPNINQADIDHLFPSKTIFRKEFKEMITALEGIYGKSPKAGIFPCSNQLPKK